jgi:DNA invertase Pin-like site-specific DNA recombinase
MQERAAIYTRLSIDRTGEGLGVERQESDCRELAAKYGWHVTAVYSDNSVSAFNGTARPAYERLLAAIKAGKVDVVIAWSHDRLNRRPKELERYVDVCEKAGISTYTVEAGHFDLTTPSGRAVARTLAAWASYEVETTIERAKASRLQAAKKVYPSAAPEPSATPKTA